MSEARTSFTHPIAIGTIPVPNGNGAIGITFCPGKKDRQARTGVWNRDLDTDLAAIRAWGCSTLLCLMERRELEALRVADLPSAVVRHGMRFVHLPIRDVSIPGPRFEAAWAKEGPALRGALERGARVLVHCRGGLGRSGTIAARLLVELGMPAAEAVATVRKARPGAIETAAQERYVYRCAPVLGPGDSGAVDRAVGALLGLAIGDAVGTTLEFTRRDAQPPLTDMVGGGPFGLASGQWTDDTSMALCLADSLLAKGRLDQRDLMERFVRWWRHGENSPMGRCFDIGNATRSALVRFERSGDPVSGSTDPNSAGNGSLMRLSPVAIFFHRSASSATAAAREQSVTTHGASAAVDACALFAFMLVEAISGASEDEVLRSRTWNGDPAIAQIAAGSWKKKERDDITSSGYVVHTLEAALWAVERARTFQEAILLAANLGDDADTVAAVTGQLAGALWGAGGIPTRWRERLAWGPQIEALARALFEQGTRNATGARHVRTRTAG